MCTERNLRIRTLLKEKAECHAQVRQLSSEVVGLTEALEMVTKRAQEKDHRHTELQAKMEKIVRLAGLVDPLLALDARAGPMVVGAKKKKLRPKDPSLYMEPVPLVPDANGNWEPLVSEIWADIEKMNKLAEVNFKADLARFRDFCDHYRTARGTLTSGGRTLSAQTRLFEMDYDSEGPIRSTKDHKWVRKLAKRVHPIVLEEYDLALNPTTTRKIGRAHV